MFQYKTAPVIETARLIIRIVSISDAKDFYEFCKDPSKANEVEALIKGLL